MFDLQTAPIRQAKIEHEAKALLAAAEREDRALTPEEEKAYDGHVKAIEEIGKRIAAAKSDQSITDKLAEIMGGKTGDARIVLANGREQKSLGRQFVESEAGKWLVETKATRSGSWASPGVELKATITEDPASGGALILPEYAPGIVPSATKPLTVAQLFARGVTGSGAVGFMAEKTFTNAAAPVLEGGIKPESALVFEAVTNPLRKIAHWIPASDEILEDMPTLQSYIDARLRLGVALKLDDQLLNGDGVAPNLLGLLHVVGLSPAIPQGAGTAADAIAMQIAAIQTTTGLKPDGVILNPIDWLHLQLAKTTTEEYLGGGPFSAPAAPTIWGLAVAVSPSIVLGTGLVGAFASAAQLWTKGGIRVDATNAHQDFFVKNLTAIRAEIRAALAVYMPAAFGTVTGLTAAVAKAA